MHFLSLLSFLLTQSSIGSLRMTETKFFCLGHDVFLNKSTIQQDALTSFGYKQSEKYVIQLFKITLFQLLFPAGCRCSTLKYVSRYSQSSKAAISSLQTARLSEKMECKIEGLMKVFEKMTSKYKYLQEEEVQNKSRILFLSA